LALLAFWAFTVINVQRRVLLDFAGIVPVILPYEGES
jgi:hypothetical protein